jgi:hypothetical protein
MNCDCSVEDLVDFPQVVDGVFACDNSVANDPNATAGGSMKYNGIPIIDSVQSKNIHKSLNIFYYIVTIITKTKTV